jgi:TnpA family transposase
MPAEFLTEEQRQRYAHFNSDLTEEELARYFHLDDNDRRLILGRRGDHNRLGFAVQLCTARYIGCFLEDLSEVPATILSLLARQLDIELPGDFADYGASRQRWDHTVEIRRHCGYREFSEPTVRFRLSRWLYALCWTGTDRPGALFDRSITWLMTHKILLPGITVLERHVGRLRARVQERIWVSLIQGVSLSTRTKLDALLTTSDNAHESTLDRLRKGPFRRSAPELVRALQRVDEIRALGIDLPVSHRIPPGRIQTLARFGMNAKAGAIERLPDDRRLATLVAFTVTLESCAVDEALDLLDILLTDLFSDAEKAGKQTRLRSLKDLDAAVTQLSRPCRVLLDPNVPDAELRNAVFKSMTREELAGALAQAAALVRPPEDVYYQELQQGWRRIRRFFPALLKTIHFGATPAGQALAEALADLSKQEGLPNASSARLDIITRSWRPHVVKEDNTIDTKAYVFCCLDRLRLALRRRDLFVAPSLRYADARIGLLSGSAWETARPTVCRSLGHSLSAEETIAALGSQLDHTYREVAARLPGNPGARIETVDGKDELILTGLDKLPEPPSLVHLREAVLTRLPRVDLPDVLLEIAARTHFTEKFTHISEREARAEDLSTSLCAVLVAESCNTGIEPLLLNDVPALRRSRLSWVHQNFIRHETLTEANACLVAAQNRIPLVHAAWGGGEVASADGLRFVVPVRTLNAGPNPKYFGYENGVTYYNLTSNQFTGLNGVVIPGTLRDSLFLLAVVLEQQTELHPMEIMTDTGAYTDVVFGLFWLLGYRFSPRIADIGGARWWRIDPAADYGSLNSTARHRINTTLIKDNWEDMLRLAGSLKLGMVQASSVMRTLQIHDRPTKLAQAVAELGRIDKTLHSLSYIDDEARRRRILTQLNRGESRHALARALFHGKRGELRQRYREGQEDQLGALGLVVNIIALWNTIYMDAALQQLRKEGVPTSAEDISRLSPLLFDHINLLGRYAFSVPEAVKRGHLRPLRRPEESFEEGL